MSMKIWLSCLAVMSVFIFQSCSEKEDSAVPLTELVIGIQHSVGGKSLVFDSVMYENEAGEKYGISKLKYYLSTLRFYQGGRQVLLVDTVLYVDARKTTTLRVPNVPAGTYDSIVVHVGVPPAFNHHENLPVTSENLAMQWPDGMGGGFHFLMLEGHWVDGPDQFGFAMHLGTDPYLVTSVIRAVPVIKGGIEHKLTIVMDANEWFKTPTTYSFSEDGVYTMGVPALMRTIADNGGDVLSIKTPE